MKSLVSRCFLRGALFLTPLALTASACTPPARVPAADPEWVSGPTDLRKVTVLVRVSPPARLRAQMEHVASVIQDPDVGEHLRAHAGGGFGSGFLVVHQNAQGRQAFVVTNRHVIEGAEDAEITFGDGATFKGCRIVFASTAADLAVLALPEAAAHSYPFGLRPSNGEPTERLSVIASGFPALGGEPSYQVTDGKVSNAHFTGLKEEVIQHTAAIDPGSSGGPLTNEAGELVGANVAQGLRRSSVYFAVPAAAIVETVRAAHELVMNETKAAWMTHSLESSCAAFGAELASSTPDLSRVDSFISNQLVADEGLPSYAYASTRGSAIGQPVRREFFESPVSAMRLSLVYRTFVRAGVGGGATGTCGKINPSDAQSITEHKPVRLALETKHGDMELRWTFEEGAWRVAGGDLLNVEAIMAKEMAAEQAESAAPAKPAASKKAAPKSKPAVNKTSAKVSQ